MGSTTSTVFLFTSKTFDSVGRRAYAERSWGKTLIFYAAMVPEKLGLSGDESVPKAAYKAATKTEPVK